MENNEIFIIIVNYFSSDDVRNCINSFYGVEKIDASKIIIVDNSCDSNEYTSLKSLKLDFNKWKISVLKTPNNLGYAGGINFGINFIRKMRSDNFFIWVLNPDTKLEFKSLSALIEKFNSGNFSIVGSVIRDYYSDKILATHGIFHKFLGYIYLSNNLKMSNKISYPIGASLLTSNLILKKTNDFDERYFLYFEELDFVLSCLKFNLKPGIAFKSNVYHKQGSTTMNKNDGLKNNLLLKIKAAGFKKLYMKHMPKLIIIARLSLFMKGISFAVKGNIKSSKVFINESLN